MNIKTLSFIVTSLSLFSGMLYPMDGDQAQQRWARYEELQNKGNQKVQQPITYQKLKERYDWWMQQPKINHDVAKAFYASLEEAINNVVYPRFEEFAEFTWGRVVQAYFADDRQAQDPLALINELMPSGRTPLVATVATGRLDLVKWLLKNGANPLHSTNKQTALFKTALEAAKFYAQNPAHGASKSNFIKIHELLGSINDMPVDLFRDDVSSIEFAHRCRDFYNAKIK